jgi:hypothetical protein
MAKNAVNQAARWQTSTGAQSFIEEISRVDRFAESMKRMSSVYQVGDVASQISGVTKHFEQMQSTQRKMKALTGTTQMDSLRSSIESITAVTTAMAATRSMPLLHVHGTVARAYSLQTPLWMDVVSLNWDELLEAAVEELDSPEPSGIGPAKIVATALKVLENWSRPLDNGELGLALSFAGLWVTATGIGVGHFLVGLALGLALVTSRRT